jgi:hypothetical protein
LAYTNFTLDIDGKAVRHTGRSSRTDVLRDHAVAFVRDTPPDEPIYPQIIPTARCRRAGCR